MTVMAIEIRFTSVTNYSSAVLRSRICYETMNFVALRRHAVLWTVASQGCKYVGQQKMKNSRMPRAEYEIAIPVL